MRAIQRESISLIWMSGSKCLFCRIIEISSSSSRCRCDDKQQSTLRFVVWDVKNFEYICAIVEEELSTKLLISYGVWGCERTVAHTSSNALNQTKPNQSKPNFQESGERTGDAYVYNGHLNSTTICHYQTVNTYAIQSACADTAVSANASRRFVHLSFGKRVSFMNRCIPNYASSKCNLHPD